MATTPARTEGHDDFKWKADLEGIGFVRRLLMARRWYRADWWFVAISTVMVVGFIVLALIPQVFAPFDPREQVGPRFLAPGERPDVEVLIASAASDITGVADLASEERVSVAVVAGEPSSEAVRNEAERLTAEYRAQGLDVEIRLRIERYETLEEALVGVIAGDAVVAVGSFLAFADLADAFPELDQMGSVAPGTAAQSFTLGTNQIGQDVLSRLIWGTRVALIIGFTSSLFSLFIGVPLGLFAGFTGGKVDRVLSVLMDSLYAFPGLILAIAITAVLGPSIINVIVAIAVLYIPTYFRIVRGQTLSVKESLYVEAARSIGAKSRVILTRYIYPNVIPSVAIIFSVNVADAILTGAGLSFLGLGLDPSTPDWGIDLARGQETIQTAWWMITFPGTAVMLVVLAFTMMGEGLMEIFNPKLRER